MLPETILKRSEGTLSTETDGESVLMSVETGKYYTLDPVGSVVWQLLEKPLPLAELQSQLIERFEGEADTIRSESKAYLNELASRGLIAPGLSQLG